MGEAARDELAMSQIHKFDVQVQLWCYYTRSLDAGSSRCSRGSSQLPTVNDAALGPRPMAPRGGIPVQSFERGSSAPPLALVLRAVARSGREEQRPHTWRPRRYSRTSTAPTAPRRIHTMDTASSARSMALSKSSGATNCPRRPRSRSMCGPRSESAVRYAPLHSPSVHTRNEKPRTTMYLTGSQRRKKDTSRRCCTQRSAALC